MRKEYLVYSKRSMVYLLDIDCGDGITERWTSEKILARGFDTIKEATDTIKLLMGSSMCMKEGDCVIVPIEIKEQKDREMLDFRAKLIYCPNSWREEVVSAVDMISALDKIFNLHVKATRVVQAIELTPIKKKTKTLETHGNLRCEKSL